MGMSGKNYRRFMVLVIAAFCWLSASKAFAETCDKNQANSLTKKGNDLSAKAKNLSNSTESDEAKKAQKFLRARQMYLEAASLNQRAYELCSTTPAIMFGVGLMYEFAGEYDKSKKWFDKFLKSKADFNDKDIKRFQVKAQESIKKFETQKVQVSFQCKTPDVMLSINGQSERACPFKLQTMPGLLVVKASWSFEDRDAKLYTITNEKVQTITIAQFGQKVVKETPKVTSPVIKTPQQTKEEDVILRAEPASDSKHPLFWAGVAGVVVGLGAGGYGLWLGGDVQYKVEQRRLTQAEASYRTNVANGLLIGGLVTTVLGLGAVYYGWQWSQPKPVTVGATVFGDGAGVTIDMTF